MSLDIQKIRADFPILSTQVHGKPLVYLDNGATSQKPRPVIQSLVDYYERINANIHRGAHGLANEATSLFERARGATERFIGAHNGNEVIFTRNATEAINLVAQTWGRANIKVGDEIVISELEHHANWVPWQMLADEKGAKLVFLPIDAQGRVDLEQAANLVSSKTKLLAVSWASNVTGAINPVAELAALAKKVGAKLLLDAAQAAPHFALKLKESGADFAAFSAHKMLGPTGVGVLWVNEPVLDSMPPWQGGGSMISKVSKEGITYNQIPWRFEAGTPNIADVIAFAEALKYLKDLGWEALAAHEAALTRHALDRLKAIEGLTIYGPQDEKQRLGVFSFNLDGCDPQDVGALLDSMGIATRTGNHCAQPLMAHYGCGGMVRASFYLYNTVQEADQLADALLKIRGMLRKQAAGR